MERLDHEEGLSIESVEGGMFRLVGESADESLSPARVLLSEAELRWLVTTAGPAMLPRWEAVR